ncbi:MAG: CoA-binding protein [Desulfitobacteriaceae bacterium]|nr:CoA-binding protein [Desulfitobacteriaceae bacterium]MDI6913598.1 CoA-binding protein [Desulfitobacteriaceae bacterium]
MQPAKQAIEYLMNPRSIAIIGASANSSKPGGRLITYLIKHGYKGQIYPINRNEAEIAGYTAYRSILDVPGEIDLACLIIPVNALFGALQECSEKGVKTVIVNASGFAEVGGEGERLQEELVRVAREGGMRVVGPNTIGVFNPIDSVFPTFSQAMVTEKVPKGSISFISQSGAVGGSMLSRAWEQGIGFSRCISSGNEADLTTADFIDYLVDDPATAVICIYLEGIADEEEFRRAVGKAAAKNKPIVVYKNGRTDLGARAVRAHTGSIAGVDEHFQELCNEYGLIRAHDLESIFDAGLALSCQPLPRGNRMGIISTSGGACGIGVDNCLLSGLEVPEFSKATADWLKSIIPDYGSARNPVDTTAQVGLNPEYFTKSLKVVADDPNIDGLILLLTTMADPLAAELAKGVVTISQQTNKPIVVGWTIAQSLAPDGMAFLMEHGIPLYPSPEKAVRAMVALNNYSGYRFRKSQTRLGETVGSEPITA